jgi:hypothetical protein
VFSHVAAVAGGVHSLCRRRRRCLLTSRCCWRWCRWSAASASPSEPKPTTLICGV